MQKRILLFFLSIILLFTLIDCPCKQARAAEEGDAGSNTARGAITTMYGDTGSEKVDLATSNNARFDYGKLIALSLDGLSAEAEIEFRIKESDGEDQSYSSSTRYNPGYYTLGYSYTIGSDDPVQDNSFANYAFTIAAVQLGVASNLRWEGATATWDAVTADKNGNSLKEGTVCNYTVSLYKDDEKVAERTVTDTGGASVGCDFAEFIQSAAGGKGKYTFSVKTTVPDSFTTYYTASNESSSNTYALYAVEVSLEKKNGIESAASGTESTFLLIPGVAECNTKNISAVAAEGWEFGSWTIEGESSTGISLGSATEADTTVTLSSNYSGDVSVTITANSKESTKPVISGYGAGTGENAGKLVATVQDTQSGLKAYAFSTKNSADSISESEWTVLGSSTVGKETVTFLPASGGNYYFYAKDADGNTEKSSESISVTVITYDGYYENGTKTDKKGIYIGTGVYTLPGLTDTSETVFRKGYLFNGWYTSTGEDGRKVTELTENAATDVTYYARWILTELAWETPLAEKTVTYTGNNIMLSGKVCATTADIQYNWWYRNDSTKDFVLKESNTTGSIAVRNVSDSGEYRLDAVMTYTDDKGSLQTNTLTGTPVTIIINPASLTVRADNKSVIYGDEAPEYTVTYEGLRGEDVTDTTKALITQGSLKCTYKQGDSCGGYAITFDTAKPFTSENYSITLAEGTLTVNPKNVNASDSTVTVQPEGTAVYTYTGSPIIPAVIAKDGEKNIDTSQYSIGYDDNVSAGDHTATVTFKENYTGTVMFYFSIVQQGNYTPVIYMEDWDYGDTSGEPFYDNETIPYATPNITYYYLEGEVMDLSALTGSVTKPVNAGTYTVYAVVKDPAGNYKDGKSAPVTFTIHKRSIYLVAGSCEWEYDGNSHSFDSYTIKDKNGNEITENQVFVLPAESFQSIKVTGAVTDVNLDGNLQNIGQQNTVSYTLTSVTNQNNYDIQCVDGVLKVLPTRLPSPANLQWESANPGTASWVAVSKSNLVVNYEVSLYMHDAKTGNDTLVAKRTTLNSETSVDFASEIHGQISADTKKSFYFKVKAVVSDSTDAAKVVKNDYTDSDDSEKSASVYTATVYLTKKLCDDETLEQAGLESVEFTGKYAGAAAVTLIAGESFSVNAEVKEGYYFTGRSWCSNEQAHIYTSVWHTTNPDLNQYFTSSYNGNGAATITVQPNLAESLTNVCMTASVEDALPSYRNFDAKNKEDYSAVTLSIQVKDTLGMKR
ncbi:MAG: MBG domain-containing protein, partial [Lachnospiraceae bacterium]